MPIHIANCGTPLEMSGTAMCGGGLGFLTSGLAEPERSARVRELRVIAMLLCGESHPTTVALAAAISDPSAEPAAFAAIDALSALRRTGDWLILWHFCRNGGG
jgi:hypothetical protein